MEVPNLPTDNLYKFLALFGLVLVIFSSYMFNQTPEKFYSDIDRLQVREKLIRINNQNDSIAGKQIDIETKLDHLKDSLEYTATLKGLQRKVDRFPKLLYLYLILFLLGGTATVIGFVKWFYKTQKFNDKILENESRKSLEDKLIVVHKVQFEKEFSVYNDLWADLIKLRNSTHSLRPTIEYVEKIIPEEERRNQKLKDFYKAFDKCIVTFDNNKPFYPEDIYKEIESILRVSRIEAIEFGYLPSSDISYFKNAEKNMDEIISKIDIVCLKIRDRIGIIKIKN